MTTVGVFWFSWGGGGGNAVEMVIDLVRSVGSANVNCNTCPFINSKTHIQGPNGSYQVNDHFDCTTSNIIYCITCTLCNKLYIGESGRKLGDRFREHLLDVKNKGSDLCKPVARHFNLPGHSHEHMEICGIYLHLGNNETRKRKEQRLIFKLGALAPNGINERFSFA